MPPTVAQEAYLRERGFDRSPYKDELYWQKDAFPKPYVYELRVSSRGWWPARLDDDGQCLEDGWCGEYTDNPITAYVMGELSAWGVAD
jgi:hypothetical protein